MSSDSRYGRTRWGNCSTTTYNGRRLCRSWPHNRNQRPSNMVNHQWSLHLRTRSNILGSWPWNHIRSNLPSTYHLGNCGTHGACGGSLHNHQRNLKKRKKRKLRTLSRLGERGGLSRRRGLHRQSRDSLLLSDLGSRYRGCLRLKTKRPSYLSPYFKPSFGHTQSRSRWSLSGFSGRWPQSFLSNHNQRWYQTRRSRVHNGASLRSNGNGCLILRRTLCHRNRFLRVLSRWCYRVRSRYPRLYYGRLALWNRRRKKSLSRSRGRRRRTLNAIDTASLTWCGYRFYYSRYRSSWNNRSYRNSTWHARVVPYGFLLCMVVRKVGRFL